MPWQEHHSLLVIHSVNFTTVSGKLLPLLHFPPVRHEISAKAVPHQQVPLVKRAWSLSVQTPSAGLTRFQSIGASSRHPPRSVSPTHHTACLSQVATTRGACGISLLWSAAFRHERRPALLHPALLAQEKEVTGLQSKRSLCLDSK